MRALSPTHQRLLLCPHHAAANPHARDRPTTSTRARCGHWYRAHCTARLARGPAARGYRLLRRSSCASRAGQRAGACHLPRTNRARRGIRDAQPAHHTDLGRRHLGPGAEVAESKSGAHASAAVTLHPAPAERLQSHSARARLPLYGHYRGSRACARLLGGRPSALPDAAAAVSRHGGDADPLRPGQLRQPPSPLLAA